MREYTKFNTCGSMDQAEFHNQLAALIAEYQEPGFGVEIQFQANNQQFCALVLQYKEKPRFF